MIDCVGVSQAAVQTVYSAVATCWLPFVTKVGVTGNSEHVGPPSGVSMEQPGPTSAVEGKSRNKFWNWMRRPPAQGRPGRGRHCWFALLLSTHLRASAALTAHEDGVMHSIGGRVELPVGDWGRELHRILVHYCNSLVAINYVVNLGVQVTT